MKKLYQIVNDEFPPADVDGVITLSSEGSPIERYFRLRLYFGKGNTEAILLVADEPGGSDQSAIAHIEKIALSAVKTYRLDPKSLIVLTYKSLDYCRIAENRDAEELRRVILTWPEDGSAPKISDYIPIKTINEYGICVNEKASIELMQAIAPGIDLFGLAESGDLTVNTPFARGPLGSTINLN